MDFLIVLFLVILSGCFSGLTLGFFSLNLTSLERKMKLGNPRAKKIYPIRKNGNLLLCTLLLGNVAVNSAMAIFLGNIATGLVAGLISTGLIVVFGEILPQAFFARHALYLGANSIWLVRTFIFVFYPVAYPMAWLLNKMLGDELATIWNKKEIEEIIKYHEDADDSEIDEDEERILLGALAFSDISAKRIATPRPVVFMLASNRTIDQALIEEIKTNAFSRIPIFSDGHKDQIDGVLFIRDLLGIDLSQKKKVGELCRPNILHVKEDIRLDKLLNFFINKNAHLACLYDEFNVFLGVVSLEDIIEEILRVEIVDEGDTNSDMRTLAAEAKKRNLLE